MNKLLKIIILLSCFSYLYAQNTVNVGIYQNKPKIFMDENNVPKGFFVDVLNKIDIMPDVAYTIKREKEVLL